MIFNKLYMADESQGGDAEKPLPKTKLKSLSASERRDWNDMLDAMQKDGVAGKKDLDQPDKSTGASYIEKYKKENPDSSVNTDMVSRVKNDHQELRTGESFAGMSPEQTRMLRKQLNQDYLARVVPEGILNSGMSRMYYPEFKKGDKNYGTDAEGYMKDFTTKPEGGGGATTKEDILPHPNSNDPKSVSSYLNTIAARPENKFLRGEGDYRQTYLLDVNKVPKHGTITFKDSATKEAKKLGLDPSLLYSSTMEEGASGLIPNKKGQYHLGFDPLPDGYHVDGMYNYGLDNFHDNFKEMVKRGYLPKNFDYKPNPTKNEQGQPVVSGFFKNAEDAMKAKAAYVRMEQDNLEDWAKKEKVEDQLSSKAKQFFTLIAFNGGPGRAHTLIKYYKDKGLLKDDKFLSVKPDKEHDPGGAFGHILPRMQMADLLKKEKYFENDN